MTLRLLLLIGAMILSIGGLYPYAEASLRTPISEEVARGNPLAVLGLLLLGAVSVEVARLLWRLQRHITAGLYAVNLPLLLLILLTPPDATAHSVALVLLIGTMMTLSALWAMDAGRPGRLLLALMPVLGFPVLGAFWGIGAYEIGLILLLVWMTRLTLRHLTEKARPGQLVPVERPKPTDPS